MKKFVLPLLLSLTFIVVSCSGEHEPVLKDEQGHFSTDLKILSASPGSMLTDCLGDGEYILCLPAPGGVVEINAAMAELCVEGVVAERFRNAFIDQYLDSLRKEMGERPVFKDIEAKNEAGCYKVVTDWFVVETAPTADPFWERSLKITTLACEKEFPGEIRIQNYGNPPYEATRGLFSIKVISQ